MRVRRARELVTHRKRGTASLHVHAHVPRLTPRAYAPRLTPHVVAGGCAACRYDELVGSPAAAVLNAVAARKLPPAVAQKRLDGLLLKRQIEPSAHGAVLAALDAF